MFKNYRAIFGMLMLCLFATFGGVSLSANEGVVFVHGTGENSDAYNDYWNRTIVDNVRSGLKKSRNYLVVNCDFNQYMWDDRASGCLAGQLTDFIKSKRIKSMVIITHSNGGNVVRWIMSNPTWDDRYPNIIKKTREVIALAPSSAGTPLAEAVINGNIFESSLGWILGYQSDAVRMQQPSWMANYNSTWLLGTAGRPALPKRFTNMYGSDVESAVWDSDSYCGGYAQNVGLEFTQNWLNSCSDGFLECSSQTAAGVASTKDLSFVRGGEPLSHAQSRRDCFGLDTWLRNQL